MHVPRYEREREVSTSSSLTLADLRHIPSRTHPRQGFSYQQGILFHFPINLKPRIQKVMPSLAHPSSLFPHHPQRERSASCLLGHLVPFDSALAFTLAQQCQKPGTGSKARASDGQLVALSSVTALNLFAVVGQGSNQWLSLIEALNHGTSASGVRTCSHQR